MTDADFLRSLADYLSASQTMSYAQSVEWGKRLREIADDITVSQNRCKHGVWLGDHCDQCERSNDNVGGICER